MDLAAERKLNGSAAERKLSWISAAERKLNGSSS